MVNKIVIGETRRSMNAITPRDARREVGRWRTGTLGDFYEVLMFKWARVICRGVVFRCRIQLSVLFPLRSCRYVTNRIFKPRNDAFFSGPDTHIVMEILQIFALNDDPSSVPPGSGYPLLPYFQYLCEGRPNRSRLLK